MTEVKRALCHCCPNNDGVLVEVENNRVVRVRGDPEHPISRGFICEKGAAAPDYVHHPSRLKYPLKREGDRGEGKWKRIGWDQALDEIADKIKGIKEEYGPEAIASSQGTGRTVDYIRRRFMNLLGSPNIFAPGTQVCFCISFVVESITYGWLAWSDLPNSNCIVIWGGNPIQSSLPTNFEAIREFKKRGTKFIVVDPRKTETAEIADIWLQVLPTTDCALLLGWMNVIINEELYDKDFVKNWTVGFDKLKDQVQKYPPERVAEITRVPKEKIEESARMYATTKPASFCWDLKLEHGGINATQSVRSRAILRAITGNLDIKGGDYLPGVHPNMISEAELEENDKLSWEQKKKQLGADTHRLFTWPIYHEIEKYQKKVGFRSSGPAGYYCKAHGPTAWRAIGEGKPYPVKALITMASNPLLTYPDTKLVYDAIKKLELYVVMDFFMTPTAQLADYVLPSATWLERPMLFTFFGGHNMVASGEKCIEPIGEAKTDFEFFRELGMRLGQEWPWRNMEEMFDYQLKPWGYTWKEFVTKVKWDIPMEYERYKKKGFATPSGKVEIYSSILERLGYDPLPDYKEPPHLKLSKEYPLILITGGRFRQMHHSEFRQVEKLRRMHPDPLIQIHPETAKRCGIADGDWVWIETGKGKVTQKARLFDGVMPDVVHAEHGWWFPEKSGEEPSLYGVWESNINVVIDSDPKSFDPPVGSWPLQAIPCKISKA